MFSIKRFHHRLCLALLVAAAPLAAHAAPDGPDLDLSVQYYSRVLTAEGGILKRRPDFRSRGEIRDDLAR